MQRHEGTLAGAGQAPLWYWAQVVESARAQCLLVHGLGEHSGRYRHVAEALTRQQMSVWALDYRGHGRSGGRRGHCGGFHELLDDVGRVAARARSAAPAQPLMLIGHSLGGLLVLAYALTFPRTVHAVVASSPALDLAAPPPWSERLLVAVLGRVWPTCAVPNGVHPEWLSHDPAVVEAYRADPLVHHAVTMGGYRAVRRAMADVRRRAGELAVPCLVLQAGDDRLVSVAASRAFAAALTAPGSAIRVYDGWYHELFNEVGRPRVLDDLCRWLAERVR
ncbi:MAG: lysophospholipase [Candidatus Omnitrophica bacterium]|nr:lysophospholipase [Candidatus Omnitrophota bacterium]